MSLLSPYEIGELLRPYYPGAHTHLLDKLSVYLELLMRWNERKNLTAVRDPRRVVQRHFGESLFLACHIPGHARTLLDLGSGAGFPGIPVALAQPELIVTLAESQHKKAAFLREAVRELGISTSVWARRAEDLPPATLFDVVALRAVDRPEKALRVAEALLATGGTLAHLTVDAKQRSGVRLTCGSELHFIPLPDAQSVPRGT